MGLLCVCVLVHQSSVPVQTLLELTRSAGSVCAVLLSVHCADDSSHIALCSRLRKVRVCNRPRRNSTAIRFVVGLGGYLLDQRGVIHVGDGPLGGVCRSDHRRRLRRHLLHRIVPNVGNFATLSIRENARGCDTHRRRPARLLTSDWHHIRSNPIVIGRMADLERCIERR